MAVHQAAGHAEDCIDVPGVDVLQSRHGATLTPCGSRLLGGTPVDEDELYRLYAYPAELTPAAWFAAT